MKVKLIKIRDAAGVAHYEEMTDLDGVIEIARQMLKEEPENAKCKAVVQWADSLGHKPTPAEFAAFFESHGGHFVSVEGENFEN